jgi:hypothetical protein
VLPDEFVKLDDDLVARARRFGNSTDEVHQGGADRGIVEPLQDRLWEIVVLSAKATAAPPLPPSGPDRPHGPNNSLEFLEKSFAGRPFHVGLAAG